MIENAGWNGKPVQMVLFSLDVKEPEHFERAEFHIEEGDNNVKIYGLGSVTEDGAFARNLRFLFE